ncbi:hypothetical protein A1O3_01267 [Capronia epimyces CBS 606.96]|uniref:Uncharacterized protein n=1 Tax=Capronia epimyces CBS 606.96 TaxID=1182542 RepID=W9YSR6_9EURO|nr:uncharacterized protein A1O3_01267 [Capronia epimyces CBS 606.96]EXJ92715.1 hypothetical protein A1O3_01267 [Capronia epimyces CBS 606.96]
MSERTFRTPSPSPSRQPSGPQLVEHPPIPNIPREYTGNVRAQGKKKMRSSSQGAPPPRVLSPPPTRPSDRGQSLDRSQRFKQPSQAERNNSLAAIDELQRTDSRNSVNFSRPLSPRPQSPAVQASPVTNGHRTPASMPPQTISPAEAEDIQYGLLETANRPVKKKKKKVASGSTEGNHLQTGTMASKPVGTYLDPVPEQEAQDSADLPLPVRRKKKKLANSGQNTHFASSDTSSRTDSDSDSPVGSTKERRANRASGVLTKQPSIVREDWEGEQNEDARPSPAQLAAEHDLSSSQGGQSLLQNRRSSNAANVSRKIEEPNVPPKTVNQLVTSDFQPGSIQDKPETSSGTSTNLQVIQPKPVRGSSLSPSRSTRFSDRLSSDLAAGQKHEPPARSVSPAKPALKHHSPAPGMSPKNPHARGSSVSPSEASDISNISTDGAPRRKKSVRVSFESQPEIVGTADTAPSTETLNKEKTARLAQGKSRPADNTVSSNDDMEELMKPRPQLPSFGSIRGQTSNSPQEDRTPAPVEDNKSVTLTSTSPVPSSESYRHPYPTTGVSSDHAVGAILAKETQRLPQEGGERRNEPLPPEVTSVEGIVSFSDSESEGSEGEGTTNLGVLGEKHDGPQATAYKAEQAPALDQQTPSRTQPAPQTELPVVSIIPPTPALEQGGPDDQWIVEVPGGFPVLSESTTQPEKFEGAAQDTVKSPTAPTGLGMDSTSENESDNDSIYSDAAEDPSELDGTGFGSIDAIVDSPIVPIPSLISSIPESPLPHAVRPQPEAGSSASWEEAQARWNDIVEQTRYSPAIAVSNSPEPKLPTVTPVHSQVTQQQERHGPSQQPQMSQPRRKKKSEAAIAAAASVPAAAVAAHRRTDTSRQKKSRSAANPTAARPNPPATVAGTAAPFRQSMRHSLHSDPDAGFRKSMRDANRQPMPDPAPIRQRQRPLEGTASGPTQQPRAALQKKSSTPAPSAVTPAPASAQRLHPVMPVMSNDSDSDSSFRKRRRRRAAPEGVHTMRRSMRGGPDSTVRENEGSRVRSISQEGRRPFSPPGGTRTMRTSMRGSIDSGVPSLRASSEAKRSSSLFGRRQKSPPPVPAVGLMQKHQSLIAGSDDEGSIPRKSKFRSRFAEDSDDEPDTTQFTPVRGIPRRGGDSDSTDLEDSSDDEKPPDGTPASLQIPSNHAPTFNDELPSPSTEKKRGFFGRLRGKKHNDEVSSPVVESPQSPPKVDASKPSQLGFASAAERDRMIEQTRAKLEASKEEPRGPSLQSHGKLQRRHQPQRMMSDSWPLPPSIAEDGKVRPSTSDGAPLRNGSARLTQGSMRATEPIQAVGRGGKKKKFPMLRKAFGLKD